MAQFYKDAARHELKQQTTYKRRFAIMNNRFGTIKSLDTVYREYLVFARPRAIVSDWFEGRRACRFADRRSWH